MNKLNFIRTAIAVSVVILASGCSAKIDKCASWGMETHTDSGQKCIEFNKSGSCINYRDYSRTYKTFPCKSWECLYGGAWPDCNKKPKK